MRDLFQNGLADNLKAPPRVKVPVVVEMPVAKPADEPMSSKAYQEAKAYGYLHLGSLLKGKEAMRSSFFENPLVEGTPLENLLVELEYEIERIEQKYHNNDRKILDRLLK
ncbi:MAG: hypothetical protein KIG84_08215 [Bacteroidales bacterium]|nr:hypothetical protein [Bacteroidales bacterium]